MHRVLTLAIVMLCGMNAYAQHSHVRVRGSARIDAHAGRSHGKLLLDGRVVDDAGTPVPSAPLAITLAGNGANVDESGLRAITTACESESPAAMHTDESGRFCFWIGAPVASYVAHVEMPATEWLALASADFNVDLAKRSVELRFDPEPRVLGIDAAAAPLDAIAAFDDDKSVAPGLALDLVTETESVVARAKTDTGGRATFVFDAATLGPPGRGALRVRFAGDADTMPSDHVAPIERDTHVLLSLAKEIEASSPEDGVAIAIDARATSATATGSVEARLDGVLVGSAALEAGHAVINATFVPREKSARTSIVQVRYLPDTPWLQPAGDLSVTIPLRGPSPWRQMPLAFGAIAVAAWLLIGRSVRRTRLDRTIIMQRPPVHEGTAGISVVKSSRSRVGLFHGRVVDAHDGTLIARARLVVQVPSFSGPSVVTSTFADEHGTFAFDLTTSPPDAELLVEAPLHTELRQRLPVAGELEIALVSRRRKLLERLVQWARRRGPPFDARPEPTPAQVRRAAESALPDAAKWAGAIERAAFDRDDVDARVENEVMDLDPDKPPKHRRER